MSETTLAPSQTADAALAADERLATKEGRSQFWRATFSCWLGTAMEYVDFALYGLAAGMVFGDVFFPEATPLVALLASFATYSVGFVARPIGALVFGWIGDRKGRRVVLITTVALMGLSTTLIGLIPSYAQIGVWAPACLVILRNRTIAPPANSASSSGCIKARASACGFFAPSACAARPVVLMRRNSSSMNRKLVATAPIATPPK